MSGGGARMTSDVSYGDPDQIAVEQATNGRYQGLLEAIADSEDTCQ